MKRTYEYLVDEELKNGYLSSQTHLSEDTLLVSASKLKSVDDYERSIQKSLLDWTSGDIEDYLRFFNAKTSISLCNTFGVIKDYATYCDKVRRRETGSNVLSNFFADIAVFDNENLKKFVNTRRQEETVISYKEYLDIVETKDIPLVARVILILLWHGTKIEKIDEVFELQKDNVDLENKTIISKQGMETLTDAEIEVIKEFYKEQTIPSYDYEGTMYPAISTDSFDESQFYLCDINSSRVFHSIVGYNKANAGTDRITPNKKNMSLAFSTGIGRRVYRDMTVQIDKKNLRPKDVIKSGALHRLIRDFEITEGDLEKGKIKLSWTEATKPYMKLIFEDLKLAVAKYY